MNDELDALALSDTNLEKATVPVGPDEHDQIAKVEHTDRVSIGVHDVLVLDPVLASAVQNHGIHSIKLT